MHQALYYVLAALALAGCLWLTLEARRPALAAAAFLLIHAVAGYQAFFLSRDMLRGDGSAARLIVPPLFGFMRIPPTLLAVQHDAVNRLAADFAAVYFTSQSPYFFKDAYYRESSLDPWRRPSRTAPLVHYIVHLALVKLPYGVASEMHLLVQFLLFYGGLGCAIAVLGLRRRLLPLAAIINACIFLTPAGMAFLERGQWSLYVASAYLWLTLGIVRERPAYFVLSALFAFVKWHSLPCVFVILCVWTLASRDARAFRRRSTMAAVYLLTLFSLLLPFPRDGLHFLHGLFAQEMNLNPQGVSLALLAPRPVVKIIPLLLIAIGYVHTLRRRRGNSSRLVPFYLGTAIASLTYPTLAFQYGVAYLLGFLPLASHGAWGAESGNAWRGRAVEYGFFAFLVLASLATPLFRSDALQVVVYWAFALAFLAAPWLFSGGNSSGGSTETD